MIPPDREGWPHLPALSNRLVKIVAVQNCYWFLIWILPPATKVLGSAPSPLAEDHESSCRQYALSSIRIPGTALVNALHERPESPKPGPLSTSVALQF